MRVHLVQYDIAWEEKQTNFATVRALLGGADVGVGDLIVLPEMFDTGFSLNVDHTNDRDGASAGFLADLARSTRTTVQGGMTAIGEDGRGRNRCLTYGPSGELLAQYDKIHPFSFGREGERFTGGSSVTTYPWSTGESRESGQLSICPAVCYDLRFPELFRAGLARGAQAFAIGANWPVDRQDHWRTLLIARAIENQAFVFAVNRCGADPDLRYAGGSLAVDPQGRILGEMEDQTGVLSVEIDPAAVLRWREAFPAWRDQSPALSGDRAKGPIRKKAVKSG